GESFEGNICENSSSTTAKGKIVFFTGMTGYQDVIKDSSNKDQIIVFTYPLIGNCGINELKFNTKPEVAGVILYETKDNHSHYDGKYSLNQYLKKWNIPLLSHVDTRAVVKRIRNKKSEKAIISQQPALAGALI
ncbi:carbamoyl-phosphate synthase domain-containing protein, partial [Paenibacillus phytohabitans]|uniref:carbamoyl-phosphate synthase domain-containing protein n=1 Tax=Paenibacillus phytohabitans TaxID=2654978 RepID=UPI00300B494F